MLTVKLGAHPFIKYDYEFLQWLLNITFFMCVKLLKMWVSNCYR